MGFEAKMQMSEGSYLISALTKNYDGTRFLYQVFDDVQASLHTRGKQLTENTYNNGTRYLKFAKNTEVQYAVLHGVLPFLSDATELAVLLSADEEEESDEKMQVR